MRFPPQSRFAVGREVGSNRYTLAQGSVHGRWGGGSLSRGVLMRLEEPSAFREQHESERYQTAEQGAERERYRRAIELLSHERRDQRAAEGAGTALERGGNTRDRPHLFHRHRAEVGHDETEAAHGRPLQDDEGPQ